MQTHVWAKSAVLPATTFRNFQHRGNNITGPVARYRNRVHSHFLKNESKAEFANMREVTEFGSAQVNIKQLRVTTLTTESSLERNRT